MDGSRFDDLTRALGQGISRRKLLRGLAGIIAGGTLAQRGVDAAGRELVICHATGNPQAPFQSMTIQRAELNLHARHGDYLRVECCANSDCPNQYGECGGGVCQNGYCVQLPAPSGTACDDGRACSASAACDGAFACIGTPLVCAETEDPCTTAVCSESAGGCIEAPVDNGTTCGASNACFNRVCSSGNCVSAPKAACTGNCADCGGVCVNLNADPNNCQSCGHVCANGSECTVATCNGGACGTASANEGMTCGTGNACADLVCRSGSCASVPKTSCTGNCVDCGGVCVNLNSDPNNCQTCGHICPGGSGCTIATCNGGTCGVLPADEGSTCGAGDACDDQICSSGICVHVPKTTCIGNCHACGGACVDLNTDPNNCQTCGHVCGGATACTMPTCSQGSCGTTPANQGGICPMPNGDTGRCNGGQCINTCPMGTSCLFDPLPDVRNALGVCANGECTCKPKGGGCNCSDLQTVTGCCSFTCNCQSGSNIGTCS